MALCKSAGIVLSFFLGVVLQFNFAQAETLHGSAWAAANPGILPYEHCLLVGKNPGKLKDMLGKEFGFIYNRFKLTSEPILACYTKKLGLAFALPVHFHKNRVSAAGLIVDPFSFTKNLVLLSNLDGKTFGEILGKYSGFGGSFRPIFGISGYILKNENQVRMKFFANSVGIPGVGIGYSWLNLEVPNTLSSRRCADLDVIVGDTDSRSHEQCERGKIRVNTDALSKLRFVKVTDESMKSFRNPNELQLRIKSKADY